MIIKPTNATLQTLFFIIILSFLSQPPLSKSCTNQEKETLLSFISSLSPPIQSWTENSTNNTNCCKWEGITCDISNSVTQISLPSKTLSGNISPVLTNLTSLSHLNLSHNFLSGQLPHELLSLSKSIITIDLSFNSLSGPIPILSSISTIQVLNLSGNFLNGSIPVINSTSLVSLNVSNNNLIGPIPTSICTLTPFLISLDISYNKIEGKITEEIGNCSVLKTFLARYNKITGSLPTKLFNLYSLENLCLTSNRIEGSLNNYPINQLTNLITLDLGTNNLTGFIPPSIGQVKNLQFLLLNTNNLTGTIPSEISNCTSLEQLSLRANNLTGDLQSINFTRLSNLVLLDLYGNNFTGKIPSSIYSCTNLNALRLSSNNLHGEISSEIQNLKKLSFLSLSSNYFTNLNHTLQILSSCKNLTALLLFHNFINETIPYKANWEETGFQNIQILSFGNSNLRGQIPIWISKLSKLKILDLGINKLTGTVPAWIGNFTNLFYLDLSSNNLSGNIPEQITILPLLNSENPIIKLDPGYFELPIYTPTEQQYKRLTAFPPVLNLSNNFLNGNIPFQIGRLISLQILDLSGNNITGQIPDPLGNLTNLEYLDLSRNDLTGLIPVSLTKLHFLSTFSVAFNDLEGSIPIGGQFNTFSNSSYEGNPNLCGKILMKRCKNTNNTHSNEKSSLSKKDVIALTLGIFFGLIIIILSLGYFFTRKKYPKKSDSKFEVSINSFNTSEFNKVDSVKDAELALVRGETVISFSEILTATKNFDQSNIIGCGGFGLVYKAELTNGAKLAIKRLTGDTWLMDREFQAEVEALSLAKHDNLVPLKGYCMQGNLRLLIYEFMENGSLDDWLHDSDQLESDTCQFLDWEKRLRITRGVSKGLLYIHHGCKMQIIHRDIKSSNILLDEKFEAKVADFGLARLIDPYMTHVTTELVGTLGYIPPEYSLNWVATLRGDIYSFGVVMLELISGKRPVEVLPSESVELVQWVREMKRERREREVLDERLRGESEVEREIFRVLEVACLCVEFEPVKRPDIRQVVEWLEDLGNY